MSNVWRVRMKSGAKHVDHNKARQYAFKNSLVGIGWGLNESKYRDAIPDESDCFDTYLSYAERAFPTDKSLAPAANRFAQDMQVRDYCWTYDTYKGEYWCGVVTGPVKYRQGGPFDEHDLHLVRPCKWMKAGTADAVDGIVRRAFAGPFGTLTKIVRGKKRAMQTAQLVLGEIKAATETDLFTVAGPEDLEDLVGLYLQSLGWSVYASSSKTTMASYEFVLVNRSTGALAGVQVKSGSVSKLDQGVAEKFDKFFVFLAGDLPHHIENQDKRIEMIEKSDLHSYAMSNWKMMPKRLRRTWRPSTNSGE